MKPGSATATEPSLPFATRHESLRAASKALLDLQEPLGFWDGRLTADSTLESDYFLLLLWLYPPKGEVWQPPCRERIGKLVSSILRRQLPEGGFSVYPKGPADVSASVKAYFALKLAGVGVDDEAMVRLRNCILRLGGIQAANSYVKLNLSIFGLYPREHVPAVPPEMILAGNLFYEMSSWTRAIVMPLAILQARSAQAGVPDGFDLRELLAPGVSTAFARDQAFLSWRNFFLTADRVLKLWARYGSRKLREKATRRAEQWMLDRMAGSDGLGAIYPPMMYSVMALDSLGYRPDHPVRAEALRQFERLLTETQDDCYFQPCFSPVWDTALAVFALAEVGTAPPEALRRAADWLLSREIRRKGDWAVKRPQAEPSGWCFEYRNDHYPDIDDTAMVVLALSRTTASHEGARQEALQRATRWMTAMQSRDGGWAAFDADNDRQILNAIPFADHNAMLDPTCPDITGRVLEALCAGAGVTPEHSAVRRGLEYLRRHQESDGSWYGRWGVNYLYGTCMALRGLRAAGEDEREAHILRAGEWIRSIQNADGGWGESCESYSRGAYVGAASTASQTAWALLGLYATGDRESLSVRAGLDYLRNTQLPGGGWNEDLATGTGFPKVFYLTYHLYRIYFPLLALAAGTSKL
jgi:squalene-hopene/tetraprenyl-beta-curcumene cyclase